jgi:peptide/nickel transport system permease protein
MGLVVLVCAVAFLGPLFVPHSPTETLGPPYVPPGNGFGLLGTDGLGRDVVSRVLDGGWRLLLTTISATLLGVALGTLAGMIAAYRQGWSDTVIMRTVDVFLSVPAIVFALLLVSVAGSHVWLVILAVALTHAPQVARVIRAAAIEITERDYVRAAELWGMSERRIMNREILPNLFTPLMVETGLRFSYSIIIVAGLSYLGFGVAPPSPDWGLMINEGRAGLNLNPWPMLAPSILIVLLAIGTNTFADAIARVSLGIDRGEALILDSAVAQVSLADDNAPLAAGFSEDA